MERAKTLWGDARLITGGAAGEANEKARIFKALEAAAAERREPRLRLTKPKITKDERRATRKAQRHARKRPRTSNSARFTTRP